MRLIYLLLIIIFVLIGVLFYKQNERSASLYKACQVESQMERDNQINLLPPNQKSVDFVTNCHRVFFELY